MLPWEGGANCRPTRLFESDRKVAKPCPDRLIQIMLLKSCEVMQPSPSTIYSGKLVISRMFQTDYSRTNQLLHWTGVSVAEMLLLSPCFSTQPLAAKSKRRVGNLHPSLLSPSKMATGRAGSLPSRRHRGPIRGTR